MGLNLPQDFGAVLTRLLAGEDIGGADAGAVASAILAGELTPAQIAGFLVALRAKDVTTEEMVGLVRAMLEAAEPLTLPAASAEAVDTCGTGGSEQRRAAATNVSTIAAFVVAGAGAPVCKHCNRKASSTSGSADLLAGLGVEIDLDGAAVARCVEEAGIGFCFAPRFHPGMRHAGPVRRELGVRTIFNFMGPLANPARVRRQVIGVSDGRMAEKVAGVLVANGATRAMVVFGHDGLDELTTTTTSTIVHVEGGATRVEHFDPAGLGLRIAAPAELAGGDVEVNVGIAKRLLAGEAGAHRDLVLLNAAAALVVAGRADDLAEGLTLAAHSMDDGSAAAALARLVQVSNASPSG